MPIRNISDRPRMPRLGKIRLGRKVEGQGRSDYPKALDHFLCPPDVIEAVKGSVPFCDASCKEDAGPIELPIMFLANDRDQVAGQWFRSYKAAVGLVCKGDGWKADALFDREALTKAGGAISQPIPVDLWARHDSKATVRSDNIECWGEGYDGKDACPAYSAAKCKRLMMLQFAIPQAPGLGVYQLDTSSFYSILNINGFLEYLQTLTGGRIAGIPLTLRLIPQEVAPNGKKKTVRVLQLTSGFSLAQLAEAMQKPVIEALLPEPEMPDEHFPEEAAIEAEAVAVGEPEPSSDEPEMPADTPREPLIKDPKALWREGSALGYPNIATMLAVLGCKSEMDLSPDLQGAYRRLLAAKQAPA